MSVSSYWREIPQRYRLEAGKCSQCGKIFYPPRLICDACKSREFEPVKLANEGKIITYTIIHTPPKQFKDQAPYAMAVVELNDGCRITVQVADAREDELAIGKPVTLQFRKIQEYGEAGILCYGHKAVLVY